MLKQRRLKNPRGAGRKPLPVSQTNIRVTVFNKCLKDWEKVEAKAEFVREAIAAKLKAQSVEIGWDQTNYSPQELLVVEVRRSSHGIRYYGQTKSGEVFEGAYVYPDCNGDMCLMQLMAVAGTKEEALEYIASIGAYPVESVFGDEVVEAALPKDVTWCVPVKPSTK